MGRQVNNLFSSTCLFPLSVRPACGGPVPGARKQHQTAGAEGDTQQWCRCRPGHRGLPPTRRGHTAKGLPGGAA